MNNPYFTMYNLDADSSVSLYCLTEDGSELIFTFREEHLAFAAEKIANAAFSKGQLNTLVATRKKAELELEHLKDLLDSFGQ